MTAADRARAEHAVHARMLVALAAARDAGLPGHLEGWSVDGLRVLLCTSPGLTFLTGVTGVDHRTVGALPGVLDALAGRGAPAVWVVGAGSAAELSAMGLSAMGLRRTTPRPLATRALLRALPPESSSGGVRVAEDDGSSTFLDVLGAGYGGAGALQALLRAEHASPRVRGFVAWRADVPVAAAALSLHGDVAVLGGASTLPEHRRTGGQAALLRTRLRAAQDAGATLATATAASGSPSARNLARAGFTVHERPTWETR